MADTPRQTPEVGPFPEDQTEGDAVADASSSLPPASAEPADAVPADATPADATSADATPADAKTAEPPTVPKEPMPGGPQAWRRDDDVLLAQADPYIGGHWSVPWSDLMMVMFVLFAVLVAVQMRENRQLVESAELEEPVPISVPEPKPRPADARAKLRAADAGERL